MRMMAMAMVKAKVLLSARTVSSREAGCRDLPLERAALHRIGVASLYYAL